MANPSTVVLPRLPANWQDNPAYFTRLWNLTMTQIETVFNELLAIPEIQAALRNLDPAVSAAQDAADAANTAAASANSAANLANDTAALTNSYVTPLVT